MVHGKSGWYGLTFVFSKNTDFYILKIESSCDVI